jgi:hypothetical protein
MVRKPAFVRRVFEFASVGKGMFTTLDPRGTRTEYLVQRKHKGVCARRPRDGAVDAHCDPPDVCQDAAHLAECLSAVGKKLQPLLT